MENRLTDEEWRKILESNTPPKTEWIASFSCSSSKQEKTKEGKLKFILIILACPLLYSISHFLRSRIIIIYF